MLPLCAALEGRNIHVPPLSGTLTFRAIHNMISLDGSAAERRSDIWKRFGIDMKDFDRYASIDDADVISIASCLPRIDRTARQGSSAGAEALRPPS